MNKLNFAGYVGLQYSVLYYKFLHAKSRTH